MALYHTWRSCLLQVQKDPQGPKVLTVDQETKINAVKKTSIDLYCVRRRRAALALMRCGSRCCRLRRGGGCSAPELTAHAWLGGMM